MNTPPAPADRTGSATPSLVDVLIILCASAAILLFLIWIATTILNLNQFQTIPGYVQDAFSSIWTSVAAGAAGLGLAVVRALTYRNKPTPNYALWTAGTVLFLLAIVGLLARAQAVGRHGNSKKSQPTV